MATTLSGAPVLASAHVAFSILQLYSYKLRPRENVHGQDRGTPSMDVQRLDYHSISVFQRQFLLAHCSSNIYAPIACHVLLTLTATNVKSATSVPSRRQKRLVNASHRRSQEKQVHAMQRAYLDGQAQRETWHDFRGTRPS